MFDNPRYALYQAKYTAMLANRAKEPATERVSVAGKCCESGDIVCADVDLPAAKEGDILAVLSTVRTIIRWRATTTATPFRPSYW